MPIPGRSAVLRTLSYVACLAVLANAGASCSSCEAKCIGPAAEITVANDVAVVEACDSARKCTRQEFLPAGVGTFDRSFTFASSGDGTTVTFDVKTFLADGTSATAGHVHAGMSDGGSGSCGCKGPAKFFVSSQQVAGL